MVPMPSTEYDNTERALMLDLAHEAIRHGLRKGRPLHIDPAAFPEHLRSRRACFVTLNRDTRLRGCIGHLEPVQTLVEDMVDNAFSAAFRDPRFPPLQARETGDLVIHVSVLSEPRPLPFSDEQDLLARLRPGEDGLILQGPMGHRGTFLPSVWEQLPDPREFLVHLRLKAGLPADFPLTQAQIARYTTESFEGPFQAPSEDKIPGAR